MEPLLRRRRNTEGSQPAPALLPRPPGRHQPTPARRGARARRYGRADAPLRPPDEHAAAAAPLFWTLGPKQVGKSAIIGWRDLLAPALRAGDQDLVLWPFTGAIEFAPGRVVVAESYPGEFYGHLGLRADRKRWSKRVSEDRAAKGQVLAAWARDAGVALDSDLVALLDRGFHTGVDGEDRFDATVGVLGMLNVVLGRRPPGDPDDRNVRRIEGWILGQTEG